MGFLRSGSILVLLLWGGLLPTVAAAATEPVSGLPLYPGAKLDEKPGSMVRCGMTMKYATYDFAGNGDKPVEFYRQALPGADSWTIPRTGIKVFLRADGRALVKIIPIGVAASTLVYGSYSSPVTQAQVRTGKC